MTISLTNLTSQPLVVCLFHDKYCENGGPCNCKDRPYARRSLPVETRRGGELRAPQVVSGVVKEPASLTIEGKSTVDGLPDAILKVPQVKTALSMKPPILKYKENNTGKTTSAAKQPEKEKVDAPAPADDGDAKSSGEGTEPRSVGKKSRSPRNRR